jgi:hypothetical protein
MKKETDDWNMGLGSPVIPSNYDSLYEMLKDSKNTECLYKYLDVKAWINYINKQAEEIGSCPPPSPPRTVVILTLSGVERETKTSKLNKANYNIIIKYWREKIK